VRIGSGSVYFLRPWGDLRLAFGEVPGRIASCNMIARLLWQFEWQAGIRIGLGSERPERSAGQNRPTTMLFPAALFPVERNTEPAG
jgi:hypothetical protein